MITTMVIIQGKKGPNLLQC